jgi:hypothetical protein
MDRNNGKRASRPKRRLFEIRLGFVRFYLNFILAQYKIDALLQLKRILKKKELI